MANSTEFNGTTHLKMRDGHEKAGSKKPRAQASVPAAPAVPAGSWRGAKSRGTRGVRVERRFAALGADPLDAVVYERRSSTITNPDGSIVFKMEGAEVPASWSQLATDILISKYFRKAGLHGDKDKGETSIRQVVRRIAHTIRVAGEQGFTRRESTKGGSASSFSSYFATKADADTF